MPNDQQSGSGKGRGTKLSKKEPPHGYQPDGTPIWHLNPKNGKPACGAAKRWNKANGPKPKDWVGEPCNVTIGLKSNGRCDASGHGGATAKPRQEIKAIRTREAFLDALAGEHTELIHTVTTKIKELVEKGNWDVLKWVSEMNFGGVKQTVVSEIGDSALLEKFILVTREFLPEEKFNEWLQRMEAELNG